MTFFDIEIFSNYALFRFSKDGNVKSFETQTRFSKKEIKKINKVLHSDTIVSFNGIKYDVPVITKALLGANVAQLKEFSDKIIEGRFPEYQIYKMLGVMKDETIDHIDLIEPSPAVMVSLKLYGTRIGSKKLQETPSDFDLPLQDDEIEDVKDYCENDLQVTSDLYDEVKPRIDLRVKLSEQHGIDLRSKSDAQIAETLIIKSVGYRGKAPHLSSDYEVHYTAPKYLKFKTKQLKDIKKQLETTTFTLDGGGKPKLPAGFKDTVKIGDTVYKLGMGGLHSQEKSLVATGGMMNGDITSMYPSLIINQGLYPKHLGEGFKEVYAHSVTERVKAKRKMQELKLKLKELHKELSLATA